MKLNGLTVEQCRDGTGASVGEQKNRHPEQSAGASPDRPAP